MNSPFDLIVIGAGAAGMAASIKLAQAGYSVSILEARGRIGGRIFTLLDPSIAAPIELGAEFIHGKPPEILTPLRQRKIAITEVDGDSWCVTKSGLSPCNFFSQVDRILQKMDAHAPDQSFLNFLKDCFPDPDKDKNLTPAQRQARRHAVDYVSGFNAADPALVSVHWLVKEMKAEEAIDGDRAFRSQNGYQDLLEIFRKQLAAAGVSVQTETVVEQIKWKDSAEIIAHTPRGSLTLTAPRVLVTLPLAVLQAKPGQTGAVTFQPPLPPPKLDAMQKLEMGKVIRIVLRFRERFWEKISPSNARPSNKTLSNMSFLFSEDEWFPTWWTTMPRKLPVITGWAPFRSAERLSGQSHDFVVKKSLETLHRLLGTSMADLKRNLEAAYFHDWQNDPFSRGAYSYAKVGADGAPEELGRPLGKTLFFAGEATDITGNNGTVHGAIASGHRAAKEILQSFKQSPPKK